MLHLAQIPSKYYHTESVNSRFVYVTVSYNNYSVAALLILLHSGTMIRKWHGRVNGVSVRSATYNLLGNFKVKDKA